jgi:hypothetical protein
MHTKDIIQLSLNGSTTSDQEVISNHIVRFYEYLFMESLNWRPKLDDLEFDMMTLVRPLVWNLCLKKGRYGKWLKVWIRTRLQARMASLWLFLGLLGGDQGGHHGSLCRVP